MIKIPFQANVQSNNSSPRNSIVRNKKFRQVVRKIIVNSTPKSQIQTINDLKEQNELITGKLVKNEAKYEGQ